VFGFVMELSTSSSSSCSSCEFLRSSLLSQDNIDFASSLQRHGYAILSLDTLTDRERESFTAWESIFSEIFQLSQEDKDQISKFDAIQGQTMGYRREGLREFIETRLQGNELVLPLIGAEDGDGVKEAGERFVECVRVLWKVLRGITVDAISCMAHYIGIDPTYFLELIDQDPIPDGEVSSTVLRICSYPFDTNHSSDSQISFGAHTDTSFLTVGTFSSTSGLEIQDLATKSWISIEEMASSSPSPVTPQVAIFVGDVMQLLTRSFYLATIHRVRTYHRHPLKDLMAPRVSCPFIVRGRHKAKIRSVQQFTRSPIPVERLPSDAASRETENPPLPTPSSETAVDNASTTSPPCLSVSSSESPFLPQTGLVELPDFEDLNMKLIHTLLDRKRQKCMKAHEENGSGDGHGGEEWVLKAF
jgi:isopenicillin N synthase-like dioxygenase